MYVQRSRSDTGHFGHFNRSCYLLTYYPVVRCNFNDMILLRTVYN